MSTMNDEGSEKCSSNSSQLLNIEENKKSITNDIVHVKNKTIPELEFFPVRYKGCVSDTASILDYFRMQNNGVLSTYKTMKILTICYFVKVHSFEALFDHMYHFTNDSAGFMDFNIYNKIKIRLRVDHEVNGDTRVIIASLNCKCSRGFFVNNDHVPNILTKRNIASFICEFNNLHVNDLYVSVS